MKNNTLILITIIYIVLSVLFNYSLFQLLIIKEFNNQYFLIFIYFFSEILIFIFFLFPKSKEKIISHTLGPIIINDGSMDISMISATDNNMTNNLTTSINATYRMSSTHQQPFIGMKFISFIIPSIFDFLSKIFIFNGLKILGNEIILRSIIQLIFVLIISKFILKSKYNNFNIIGIFVILLGLIASCICCRIFHILKLYFEIDLHGILGMILCLIGEIFSSIHIFFQMKYFKIGEKFCYREIAWEGFFGLIISFIFFELSLFIPCPQENNNEIKNEFFFCYNDSSLTPFKFLLNNLKNNITWNIIYFIMGIFYNLVGAVLAKYIGEVFRVGVDAGRISIILYLILFIHTKDISLLSVILSGIFLVIIIFGIILCIILRNQKDITFDAIPLDKSSQDLSLIDDEEENTSSNDIDIQI